MDIPLLSEQAAKDESNMNKRPRVENDDTDLAKIKQKSVTLMAKAPSPPPLPARARPKPHASGKLTNQSKKDITVAAVLRKDASASKSRAGDTRADVTLGDQDLDVAFCPPFPMRGSSSQVVQQDDSGFTDEAVVDVLANDIVLKADYELLAKRKLSEVHDACLGSAYNVMAQVVDMANREKFARRLQKEAERKLGTVRDDLKLASLKVSEMKSQLLSKDKQFAQTMETLSAKVDELRTLSQYNASRATGWVDFGKRTDKFVTHLMEQYVMSYVPEEEQESLCADLTEKAQADALQLSYFGQCPEPTSSETSSTDPTSPIPRK